MESLLSSFQIVSLDQIQNYCGFSSFFLDPKGYRPRKIPLFPGFDFSYSRRDRWRRPTSHVKCSSLKQGLQPRPKPKPKPNITQNLELEVASEETQSRKPASGLCAQIEKLVYYKRFEEALELFEIFECGNNYDVGSTTYDALVTACIGLRSIRGVKRVSRYMFESGVEWDQYLQNRVLLMHVKCGMMIDARRLFDDMAERNLVSWNTIMGGLVDSGEYNEAFQLFLLMWSEFSDANSRMFATMIRASAGLGLVSAGRQLHSCVLKMGIRPDIFVSCSLIDMYSKCGNIEDAQFVFDEMPEKTVVGWNSIIAGYALHGYSEEALSKYHEMQCSGVKMDHFTYSIIIRICTRLASLEHARQAHAGLVRHGFGLDVVANTALVDLYSKWGRIEDARHVFDNMPRKNVISWNALIAGYANHGRGVEAVEMFEKMLCEVMVPNHVTFLAVLSACSYSGLSDKGWEIFESMSGDYNIKPRAMHYACMIELLGREGLLDEAFALIRDAPFKPTLNMWAALLTACRVHKNLELGKFAAEKLYGMEPEKLNNYILLLNIYNSSGRLEEAAAVVQTLKRRGLRMLPACSWIDVKKKPHIFLSGDKSHIQTKEIYQKVDSLMLEITKRGHIPIQKSLLPDVDEQEAQISFYHSEKLAIAFGLINTSSSTSLQIVQSHRICADCHEVIKLIASVTGRVIVVRDASRFHHFKDGTCSCGDYW
ncbi:pentatricopeptide repeat-containing protein At5g50390, chloroplastic [Macadamia integrifolia]|uniref:pentatricopeptide repeat-containing protein At5g50390, chloroplastic n=1 Tax=Macadamia integrifolia TaxID=60698 RepID=UPI001C4E6FB2|nr:pentatricopeptide repeat-containing protein At5g50390, chloroplastic [Macadamia integrifolia]